MPDSLPETIPLKKSEKPLLYDPAEKRIRSFVIRAGRLSPAQERALCELTPLYGVPFEKAPLDLAKAFGRKAETILEIGFGMGDTTAKIAEMMPEKNFLGIEVHAPGVGSLLRLIEAQQLRHVRIIRYDAVEVITHMIQENTLSGIHVFFPDPWHKARHNKRRLIQAPFVRQLAGRLKPGGYLHCATDWEPYAEQMLEVLTAEPLLANTAAGYAPRPAYRPETKFEKRGKRLGHGVWDLIFRKR
ncbi:MAG: tRNA (guanosine(46)-N7)-methyltransferase TrmB [Oxalobacter formigenes]|nr:tRNA (guanosine(46)-N7)-methyltransferase TrmB [Oxalobacter formigenes]